MVYGVTVELISNTIFLSQGTEKTTRFKWKLEEGRLSKVLKTSHAIKKANNLDSKPIQKHNQNRNQLSPPLNQPATHLGHYERLFYESISKAV